MDSFWTNLTLGQWHFGTPGFCLNFRALLSCICLSIYFKTFSSTFIIWAHKFNQNFLKVLFPNMYWILTAFPIVNGILVPPLLHKYTFMMITFTTLQFAPADIFPVSLFKILFSTFITWSSQKFNWGFCSQKGRRVGIALTLGQWHFGTTPGFCFVPGGLISRSGSTPWTVGGSSHVAQKQIYGLNSQFKRHFLRVPWPLTVHWGPRNHDDGTRTGFCLICFNCMSKFVETTTQEMFAILLWRIENRLETKKIFCRQTTPVRLHRKTTHRFVGSLVW